MMKKSIMIVTHARADLLEKLLKSLRSAEGIDQWSLLLVWQTGLEEVEKIVNANRSMFTCIIQVPNFNARILRAGGHQATC